ncbi:hypothetical protein CC80DRAFT_93261 [Byssothecium circinans]|uniref:Uncharacterized protein n=1 Tax=Byssothecium circinans TaxID=147558 RepID=A0A6A5TR29_9PLEO|nr:hypothetical protein CC80DRAFT_93261 [Byssothecium circinans]
MHPAIPGSPFVLLRPTSAASIETLAKVLRRKTLNSIHSRRPLEPCSCLEGATFIYCKKELTSIPERNNTDTLLHMRKHERRVDEVSRETTRVVRVVWCHGLWLSREIVPRATILREDVEAVCQIFGSQR